MKFTLSSLNPFAWWNQKPLTANQIRLWDLNQDIKNIDEDLMELELERIDLEHRRMGYVAQREFILEGEPIQPQIQPIQYQDHGLTFDALMAHMSESKQMADGLCGIKK